MNKKEAIIVSFIAIFTFVTGYLIGENLLSIISLWLGFVNAYLMSVGKWYNYIFGILFSITTCYIYFLNGLYGYIIFNIVVFLPIQIYAMITWKSKQIDSVVETKSLSLKSVLILYPTIIIASVIIGYLLMLLPGQKLAFLDSTAQILNIGGVTLAGLRYKNAWEIWLLNNIIDLTIWIVNCIKSSDYSVIMLIISVMYLAMNIYGLISWKNIEKCQKGMKNT